MAKVLDGVQSEGGAVEEDMDIGAAPAEEKVPGNYSPARRTNCSQT